MKTKLFALFLAFTLSVGTMFAWDYEHIQIDDLYYNLDRTNNIAEVTSGTDKYSGSIVIPSSAAYDGVTYSITSIGDYAFNDCNSLISITIPNSVTSIGKNAFQYCKGLTSVTIPNSVTSIGVSAFNNCTGLTSITIPNSVKSIEGNAFYKCTGLTSVTIGDSVTSIGNYAFEYCKGLTSVTIPNSVISIGRRAFSNCSGLTSVIIGESVTSIGDKAFYCGFNNINTSVVWNAHNCNGYNFGSQVESFVFGNEVEVIPASICSGMTQLISITIPNSVTNIGNNAFENCTGLLSLTIPNSVTSVGEYAFSGCTGLTSVTIGDSVTSIGDNAFYNCTGLTLITIPNSVTSIGDNAFSGCTGLTSVTIGDSVTTIGSSAFENCTGLLSLTIPNSVTSIGDNAFYNVLHIAYSGTATGSPWGARCMNGYVDGYLVFNDDTKKTLLACHGAAIGKIDIPSSVTSINNNAFYGCTGLTSVTIPTSVTSIGDNAFYNVDLIAYCGTATGSPWGAKNIVGAIDGFLLFKDGAKTELLKCLPAAIGEIIVPNSVKSIEDNAFAGCTGITSITIPDSVTSIGFSTFSGCSSLTAITIPVNVRTIDNNAFEGCSIKNLYYLGNLDQWCEKQWNVRNVSGGYTLYFEGEKICDVIIPDNMDTIRENAFSCCTSLTSITIPNGVTNIGGGAFSGCSGLTSITIPASVTSIGRQAFYGCTVFTSVTIPNSITSIEWGAFTGCDNLKTIILNSEAAINVKGSTRYNHGAIEIFGACQIFGSQVENIIIGDDVTNIGVKAFVSISNLQSITIGKSVTNIDGSAFPGGNTITSVVWNAKNSNGYNFGSQVNSFIFGSEVEVIPASICSGMTQLTSMTIPNSVTSIGDNAFSGCTGLTEIVIPINITNIGNSVFSGCNSITSVYWNAKNSNGYNFGSQVNSFIFGNEVEIIPASICSGMTQLTSMTIPNSVTSIGDNAFSGCARLTAVTIPSNVAHIGDGAFHGCPGLSSMIVENGNTEYDSRDNCNAIILSASNTLIFGCKNTKFPSSVTSIGKYAFNGCSSLKSVIIPNHVTNVGEYAFNDCSGMTSATVSSNMKTISSHMFNNCARLSSVIMNGNVTNIEEGAFAGCTSLTSITIPDNVTNVGMYAFDGCSGLTSAITSNNMTVIKSSTFRNCSRLASVTIGRNVTDVESGAFYGCPLTSVTLLSNAIVSRNYTPESNISNIFGSQIKEYILGANINRLGNNAFYGCSGVQSITILRTTPPSGYTSALDNICYAVAGGKFAPIYVPCGCFETYSNSWFSRYYVYYAPYKYKIKGLVNSENMGRVLVAGDVCGGISAEAYEGYHFVQWSDGETDNPRYVELTKDTTFKAIFAINEYVITWLNEDSSLIDQKKVVHGVVPTHSEPIKPATAEYTYTFAGWTPAVVAATSDATYRAQFKATKNSYTITWQNEDGSLIDQTTVEYGVIPTHADPVKQNTAEYTYTFAGWTPAVVAVTGDATYKATFNATKNKYLITFRNDDGTVLKSEEVEYGVMPIVPTDPTKESTAQYDYTFAGWTPAVAIVTQAATYTATYTSALREYLVTFLNEDSTVISSKNYKYGETPVAPADPVKQNTAEYTYTFNGWDHAIAQVQGPQTYKATFTATKNSYTITWQDENGSLIDQTIVEYGQIPAHADPIKQNTAEYTYTFSGWTPVVVAVTGNATYRATFSATKNSYTITWQDENGSLIDQTTVEYGVVPTHTDPIKQNTAEYTYTFAGWTPAVVAVTGDATYKATFSSVVNVYTIYVSAVNGQVIGGGEYQYGATIDLTAIPDEGYVFDQWSDGVTDNPRTITVTGDVEYTALFKSAEGFENIYTSEPVQKVIIDQKVYILRGEKVYTLQGQEVK